MKQERIQNTYYNNMLCYITYKQKETSDTDSTKYNETVSLTDNKLDSEILSFFWAGEDREVLLASDETVRGGTRRALGQEITPDSGVVVTCLISS